MAGKIEKTIHGATCQLTFDNQPKRNAMSFEMWTALLEHLRSLEADDTVWVVVLRGGGDKAFVSGSDVSSFGEERNSPENVRRYNETVESALARLALFPKPVIAAVTGYCIGGGVSIAAACDLRLASADSSFAVPAGRLGVGYSRQQIERLQGLVGHAMVRDMIFTARRVPADEALRRGLVDAVVEPNAFEALLEERVGAIVANAPLTLRAAKMASLDLAKAEAERDPGMVDGLITACFESEDYREGQAAFAEKRPPVFRGR